MDVRKVDAVSALAAELMMFLRILEKAWMVPFGTMSGLGGRDGCVY